MKACAAAAFLSGGLMLASGAAISQPVTVTGEVYYRQRVAMPADAEVLVEVTDPGRDGLVLQRHREPTRGRQPPIAFSFALDRSLPPCEGGCAIRATVLVDDVARRVSKPVRLPAALGTEVALGRLILDPFRPLAFANQFDCGGQRVLLGARDEDTVLRHARREHRVRRVASPEGVRYVGIRNPRTQLQVKGDAATVVIAGRALPACRRVDGPARSGV